MKSAEFIQSTTRPEEMPNNDRPHVAIIGRSNVGKSSLVNHLTGKKNLAHTSSKAGRTETVNLYDIDHKYYMVDLPGYGFTRIKTKRGQFADLITDYISNTPQLSLVLVIIDAFVGPSELDIEMFEFLRSLGIPLIIIVNKVDKLSKNKVAALIQQLSTAYDFATFIPHSITMKAHRGEILKAIDNTLARK